MVSLNGVTKDYRLGRTVVNAVKGIDLEINEGEFVSICGPSGSGKSTLLNLIGCLDMPTTGTIRIMGEDVSRLKDFALSKLRNNHIGFIFQMFNLIPVLTAYENVEYPLLIHGMKRKERQARVSRMLDEVGLNKFIKHKPDELSGGQRQRVAIARALVTNPKIVLADEPTANLDSQTGIEILELMKRINEEHKTTFIFSTHDPKVVRYAKRVYNITDGRINS
ncbi:MAG: ABC transporter ATP-binding protein [Nitrospinae bacterium]|nr:ABC transporter ATP-binding protein [Nitrospinota bacterium]